MRRLVIAVVLLIALALGVYLFLAVPKSAEVNTIEPLQLTKQQTELLKTLNLQEKVSVFNYKFDQSVQQVNIDVSIYNKGSLVNKNGNITYIYDDVDTTKDGEIVLNYSTDQWVINLNENGTRVTQNISYKDLKNYITNFKVSGEATYYQNQQLKISKDKPVVLHMTSYMESGKGYSNNIIEQCSQDLSYLKELDWVIVTKLSVK